MPTFDGINLVITLDPGNAGVLNNNVITDYFMEWKDWLLENPVNRKYPHAFVSDGGNPLSSIINQGSYIFLNNTDGWRIKPPEEDVTVYLTGNLAVADTSLPAFIPTDGDYTSAILGLQPVTQGVTPVMADQLAYSSFQNAIHYNPTSPWSGTGTTPEGDLIGTHPFAVNNLTDMLALVAIWGFATIHVSEGAVLGNEGDFSNLIFQGNSRTKTEITVGSVAQVRGCEFLDAHVLGTLDGDSKLFGCKINNLNYVNGEIERCELAAGVITLGGGAAAQIIDSWSGVIGVDTPTIDLGGAGQSLAMRSYDGGVRLRNKNGPESISIDLAAGQIRIDLTSVTDGVIVCRGDGKVVDDATGDYLLSGMYGDMELINDTSNSASNADAVWEYDVNKTFNRIESAGRIVHDLKFGDRMIYVDTDHTWNGNGTSGLPFNTIEEAVTVAKELGVKKIVTYAAITIPEELKHFTVVGVGAVVVNCNGQNLAKSEFTHCTMRGEYTGHIVVTDSVLDDGFHLNGFFHNCALNGELVCVANTHVLVKDCSSNVAGFNRPSISLNGAGGFAKVSVRNYSGGLNLKDCNNVDDEVTLEFAQGNCEIESTCILGNIKVGGGVYLTDNSAGSTVNREAVTSNLIWDARLVGHSIADTFGSFVKKILTVYRFISLK